MPKQKKRKKSLVGWVYDDEDYAFSTISAWNDNPLGVYFVLLKHKKDLGKFKGKKINLTIEEL